MFKPGNPGLLLLIMFRLQKLLSTGLSLSSSLLIFILVVCFLSSFCFLILFLFCYLNLIRRLVKEGVLEDLHRQMRMLEAEVQESGTAYLDARGEPG